jgi:Domain of unknown function (DUF397)
MVEGAPVMDNSKFSAWRKSGYSNNENCLEVAATDRAVGVRDSKQTGEGPVLEFTRATWDAFIRVAKDGELDL